MAEGMHSTDMHALCTSLAVARVAYAEAIRDRHRSWITLRQGIRIIDERKALTRARQLVPPVKPIPTFRVTEFHQGLGLGLGSI